jgi:AraC-like DNA-binding protein
MDALSQVLRSFHLRASFLAAWDLGAPWGLSFRPSQGAPFHYVESGDLSVVARDGSTIRAEAGDVIVVFSGAGHRIGDKPASPAEPIEAVRARQPPDALLRRHGGSGRRTKIVCGMFHIDERIGGPVTLRQLPPLFHIRGGGDSPGAGFKRILELLAIELRSGAAGAEHAAALLTEGLLIHVLRYVLATDAPVKNGWLEGLRDPQIAAALAAIHGEPEKNWTLATLARRAGLSRSAFADRFHARVGVPPMTYLTSARLELAARWLRETTLSVAEIYNRLGYASASAFHRAFKRERGVAPSAFRERGRARA